MEPDFFDRFHPDAETLLRRISVHVDDHMLNEIAAADYGSDIKEHLAQLRKIRDHSVFETPMGWHPQEVLELIRWSEPEDASWKPGAPGVRGHWMRAFACAALLRAAGYPANHNLREGWNQTLIQLLDSLRIIETELYKPALAFLAWLIPCAERDGDIEELGFFMIGFLWLALQLPAAISDDDVIALAERISAETQRALEESASHVPYPEQGWFLRTTVYDLRHEKWKRLGRSLVGMELDTCAQPRTRVGQADRR